MRTLSVIAGGSLLGVVGLAGLLLMPAAETTYRRQRRRRSNIPVLRAQAE